MAVAVLQISVVGGSDDDEEEEGEEGGGDDDDYVSDRRRDEGGDDYGPRRGKGKGKGKVRGETDIREIDEAFRLFIGGGGGDDGGREEVITLGALRRVARELKEEVADSVLRDMILEANGGAGVGKGVRRGEFEGVMRRAGVFR